MVSYGARENKTPLDISLFLLQAYTYAWYSKSPIAATSFETKKLLNILSFSYSVRQNRKEFSKSTLWIKSTKRLSETQILSALECEIWSVQFEYPNWGRLHTMQSLGVSILGEFSSELCNKMWVSRSPIQMCIVMSLKICKEKETACFTYNITAVVFTLYNKFENYALRRPKVHFSQEVQFKRFLRHFSI
jgi:hypothetical protein